MEMKIAERWSKQEMLRNKRQVLRKRSAWNRYLFYLNKKQKRKRYYIWKITHKKKKKTYIPSIDDFAELGSFPVIEQTPLALRK